jgi:hypothetical protein
MKKMFLLALLVPSFSFAADLVPATYTHKQSEVRVENTAAGQVITIIQKGHLVMQGTIAGSTFSVTSVCDGVSSVTEMGELIQADCNTDAGDRFRLVLHQQNGVLQAVATRHDTPGMFGGGYKLVDQVIIPSLQVK